MFLRLGELQSVGCPVYSIVHDDEDIDKKDNDQNNLHWVEVYNVNNKSSNSKSAQNYGLQGVFGA